MIDPAAVDEAYLPENLLLSSTKTRAIVRTRLCKIRAMTDVVQQQLD